MGSTVKISWSKLEKYQFVMDTDLSCRYFADYLLDKKSFDVDSDLLEQWEDALKLKKEKDKQLFETANNNNKGIAFEKVGEINKAKLVYEQNLLIGYPATHSFERLMIIYHKEKQFDDEIRVIEKTIDVFSKTDDRYKKNV